VSALTHAELEEWAKDHIRADQAKYELWRRYLRWLCRNNLWFLAHEVLGNTEMDDTFHLEQCRRMNSWAIQPDGRPFKLMGDFWPRGGFKTTIGTQARATQAVLRCPEETIQIRHGIIDKAEEILGKIILYFEENKLLRWLFPDIIWEKPKSQAKRWKKDQIYLRRAGPWQEPTFSISSAEATAVGGHYTMIFFDDWVCDENTRSLAQMNFVYDRFRAYPTFKDQRVITPDSPMWQPWYREHQFWEFRRPDELWLPPRNVVMATFWDARDANSRITDQKSPAWAGKVEANIVVACTKPDGAPDEKLSTGSKSFFPGRFDLEELREIRDTMGPSQFSSQYMQNPYPEGAQIFKRGFFRYWSEHDEDRCKRLPKNIDFYTSVDPNIKSDDPNADHGVVMTVAVDSYGNFYLIRVDRGHFTPEETIQLIFKHARAFRPKRIAVESAGYQETLKFWIKQREKLYDYNLPLKLMTRGGRSALSKERRIQGWEPHAASHRIYVLKGDASHEGFIDEACNWRPGRDDPDDQLDAFTDIVQVAKPPRMNTDEKVEEEKRKAHDDHDDGMTGEQLLSMVITSPPRSSVKPWRRSRIQTRRAQ